MTANRTYRAAVAVAPGKLAMIDRPIEEPGFGQVRIRVEARNVAQELAELFLSSPRQALALARR